LPVLMVAGAVLATASLALATETTRAEYVAQVEPICKANTKANERILKGVEAEVKHNKLKPAATQFSKASTALKKTLAQLKAVPQPTADKAKLTKWLGYVKTEAELFQSTAKKLKAGDKAGTEKMSLRLHHTAELANDTVLSFNFTYCRFEPSKFS
jgi:hypothetical protein